MKEIQLTQGKMALVDDESFETLNQFKWYAKKSGKTFYAVRNLYVCGRPKQIYMHCVIMNRKGIDHIDHDGCNNQKSNLRVCTRSENQMNRTKQENTSSIYKGVYFSKAHKKWKAEISINSKKIRLGNFDSEIDAAKAYNAKAVELFLEFANLNIIN